MALHSNIKKTVTKKLRKTISKRTNRSAVRPMITDIKHVYNENDYNSNDGMLTSVWGPGMWHYLHTMSFNYPVYPCKNDKKYYRNFILSLRNVLPCGKCRMNLCKNLIKLPLTMKHMANRSAFSKYVFDLHELVNTMLCKKSGLSYDAIRERYEHFRARCDISKKGANKTKKNVHFAKKDTILKENGCTESLYGEKSKCVLQIVPQNTKCDSLRIDKACIKQRHTISSVLKKTNN